MDMDMAMAMAMDMDIDVDMDFGGWAGVEIPKEQARQADKGTWKIIYLPFSP